MLSACYGLRTCSLLHLLSQQEVHQLHCGYEEKLGLEQRDASTELRCFPSSPPATAVTLALLELSLPVASHHTGCLNQWL